MPKGPQQVNTQESADSIMRAYTQNFPNIARATNKQIAPTAAAQLAADRVNAPASAQLQTDIYRQQAPQLAAADAALMKGAGKDLVQSFTESDRLVNPEWYASKESSAKSYDDLLSSINMNGLSGGERAEAERSINRSNIQGGNAKTSSEINTVENAMQFGDRVAAKGNRLVQALDVGSRLMPAMKSGADVFQMSTGKSSGAIPGTATMGAGNNNQGLANSFLSQVGGASSNYQTNMANKQSGLDKFSQVMGSLPSYS